MTIIVSQQDKKISIEFHRGKIADKFIIAKADEFLNVIDKFIRKHKICPISRIGQMGPIEFHNVGLLTERTIRVIMRGLSFS